LNSIIARRPTETDAADHTTLLHRTEICDRTGWSDADIDRLIKQAQREVEHLPLNETRCLYQPFRQRGIERIIVARRTRPLARQVWRTSQEHGHRSQVFEVLQRPYFVPRVLQSFIDGIRRIFSKAELVTITERIVACRDPTDDKFLELTINGRADVSVTGDLDLLVLNPFRGLPIITPMVLVYELARLAD
jgi:hypothetical protein